MDTPKGQYLKNLLIATDQWINALCGGYCDETLSSRAHRRRLAGNPRLADWLDRFFALFGDRNHCQASFESERLGRQLPPELRG